MIGVAQASFACLPACLQYRRLANIYFTINAALSLTDFSPVRLV